MCNRLLADLQRHQREIRADLFEELGHDPASRVRDARVERFPIRPALDELLAEERERADDVLGVVERSAKICGERTRGHEELERSACPTCGSCSGMFTANSMNCLNEALGLALPGNGTLLATHARRWELFEAAGKRIVELAKQHYVGGDDSVLPRKIATLPASSPTNH